MMGSGKSTLARHISAELNYQLVDTDSMVEQLAKLTIPEIFNQYSEQRFREYESEVANQLSSLKSTVISTGGGFILSDAHRHILKTQTFCIYLDTPVDVLVARTQHSSQRPLLDSDSPKDTLTRLLDSRSALYQDTAHWALPTANQSVTELTSHIIQHLNHL